MSDPDEYEFVPPFREPLLFTSPPPPEKLFISPGNIDWKNPRGYPEIDDPDSQLQELTGIDVLHDAPSPASLRLSEVFGRENACRGLPLWTSSYPAAIYQGKEGEVPPRIAPSK